MTSTDQPPAYRAILASAGGLLIAVWAIWFAICLKQEPLPRAVPSQSKYDAHRVTNILLEPMIGLDFHYNYLAARQWYQGQSQYAPLDGGPAGSQYEYPPLTVVTFIWTNLFPPGRQLVWTRPDGARVAFAPSVPAILTWIASIIAIVIFCSWFTCRNRATLGLARLPFLFVLGTIIVSYPILFEIERANCNVLPLLAIAVAAIAVSWQNRPLADVTIGLCAAFAIGIKPYAIVLLPGLLTLRRWRAVALAVIWLTVEAAVFAPEIRAWLAIALTRNETNYIVLEDWSHSIVGEWRLVCSTLGWSRGSNLPPQLTIAAVLIVVSAIVGLTVYRRPRDGIAWPYLLWLTAVGTMLLPVAYDYNLIFLPFAIAGAWSVRDSWPVHTCVALVLLWCQPFYFGITGVPLLALKVVTILASGSLITSKLHQVPAAPLLPWKQPLAATG